MKTEGGLGDGNSGKGYVRKKGKETETEESEKKVNL